MKRRNNSRFRAVISSPVTVILSLALFALLARAAYNIHSRASDSSDKLAQAKANLDKAQANQIALQSQIDSLSTEAGVEASIREKYHAVQPGESVAVIVDDSVSSRGQVASPTPAAAAAPLSWWQRMLHAIGL